LFTNIITGQTQSTSTDLSGKTVEGDQIAEVTDMDLAGGSVLIDTNDAVIITMSIHGLKVSSATAVFPDQDVVTENIEVELESMGDIELVEAGIKSGFVKIEVVSTAQVQLNFNYKIPSATKGGVPFET